MKTNCFRCKIEFGYEPIEGFPGIVPMWCEACGDAMRQEQETKQREQEDREKAEKWAGICPESYRTVEEGGITSLERLQTECPLEIPKGTREMPGLVIAGKSGRGKTRWMWRVLRKKFDRKRSIVAFTARGFEASYRDAEGNYRLMEFLETCNDADCFFLDDLGKSKWSQNTLETFYEVIESRSSHLKPIYVTTNFSGDGLADQLQMDSGIMVPLNRRLREFCRCVSV